MKKLFLGVLLSLSVLSVCGQFQQHIFKSSPRIDPELKNDLLLEIDNVDFFKNNEYFSEVSKGYTLGGFWIIPKLVYFPSANTKFEFGWYLLQYMGANHYPAPSPAVIPDSIHTFYPGKFRNKAFLRFQWSPREDMHLVLGALYGGANHGLIEPLYQWERNFSANPEDGIQFLYKNNRVKLDVWIDWQNFIFKQDPELEQFTVGVLTEVNFTRPGRDWQLSMPVQLLAKHYGGQIDDTDFGTLSLGNAALGLKLNRYFGKKYFKSLTLEAYGLGSLELGTTKLPYQTGNGLYGNVLLDLSPFSLSLGYWSSSRFISIMGEPLLQSLSYMDGKTLLKNRDVMLVKAGYDRDICKGVALGAYFEGYYVGNESGLNYTYGLHVRFNQQIFLKKKVNLVK